MKITYLQLREEVGIGRFIRLEGYYVTKDPLVFTETKFYEYRKDHHTKFPGWPIEEWKKFRFDIDSYSIIKDPIKILELYAKFPDKDALAPHIIEDLLK